MKIRIFFGELGNVSTAEVIAMPKKSKAGTNVQKVRKQNERSAQSQPGQYGTEFAEETTAEEVRKQNQKSQQNKQ